MDQSRRWLWLLPAALAAHNVEEYLWMGAFLEAHREAMPPVARDFLAGMTAAQFDLSLLGATLLLVALTVLAVRSEPGSVGMGLALGLGVGAGLFVNALQHTATSLFFGAPAPGVVTGWLVLVPVGAALTRRAFLGEWLTPRAFLGYTALGTLVLAGSVPALHALSGLVLSAAS